MAGVSFPVNNVFTIFVNFKETQFGFVRRVAHELVHVKQIESRKLKRLSDTTFSWKGEIWDYEDYYLKDHSEDEISEFEQEAFEKERILANKFWKWKENNEKS